MHVAAATQEDFFFEGSDSRRLATLIYNMKEYINIIGSKESLVVHKKEKV